MALGNCWRSRCTALATDTFDGVTSRSTFMSRDRSCSMPSTSNPCETTRFSKLAGGLATRSSPGAYVIAPVPAEISLKVVPPDCAALRVPMPMPSGCLAWVSPARPAPKRDLASAIFSPMGLGEVAFARPPKTLALSARAPGFDATTREISSGPIWVIYRKLPAAMETAKTPARIMTPRISQPLHPLR